MRLRRALLRPGLTRLIALLLLLQWGTAFAHCLRAVAPDAPLHVEICTADGLRLVALPPGGEEDQGTPGHASGTLPCPACLGGAAPALAAAAPAIGSPVLLAQAADPPPPPSTPLPTPPASCRPPPRAPPTS